MSGRPVHAVRAGCHAAGVQEEDRGADVQENPHRPLCSFSPVPRGRHCRLEHRRGAVEYHACVKDHS